MRNDPIGFIGVGMMGAPVKNLIAFGARNGLADTPSSLMIGFMEAWAGVRVRKKPP